MHTLGTVYVILADLLGQRVIQRWQHGFDPALKRALRTEEKDRAGTVGSKGIYPPTVVNVRPLCLRTAVMKSESMWLCYIYVCVDHM